MNTIKLNFNLVEYITEKRDKAVIIWLCNIGAEKYWNTLSSGIVDINEDIIVNHIEEMNLLICREQDIMILRKRPDEQYLQTLRVNGFSVPQILSLDTDDLITPISELVLSSETVKGYLTKVSDTNEDVYFAPYAVTHIEEAIANACGLKILGSSSTINAIVNDKVFSREVAEKLGFPVCDGKICSTIDEIKNTFYSLKNNQPYYEKIIIKEQFGASGKGLHIVEDEDKLNAVILRQARYARKNKNSKWLVEGWYNKKADVNYQIYISPDGEVNVFSIKQQILNNTVYIGSKTPPDLSDDVISQYITYGQKVGKYLYEMGFSGVAGIDSIISINDNIIPIIEINGRFTLSTYISFIERSIGRKKIMARYYRIVTPYPMNYNDVCKILNDKGILYSQKVGKGVFVYTSATLPTRYIAEKGYCIGRLFILMVGEQWYEIDYLNEIVEKIIKDISIKTQSS